MIQILFTLLLSVPAFAHDQPAFELDFSKPNLELNEVGVQNLIHQSHELIEGDESGSFVQRWRGAFNLKARLVDSLRWSASMNDNRYRNLAIDSLFLFGLSHTTEMASGPILLAIGYAHSWPEWLMGAIAGGGTIISIPGFDPLCMVAFAFYAKSEKFRGGIGWLRLASLRGLGRFARITGLNDYVSKLFARPSAREYLEQQDGLQSVIGGDEGSLDFHYLYRGIELTVHYQNETAYLEQFTLLDEVLDFNDLRKFGWNARDLICSLSRDQSLAKPYFIRDGNIYKISPGAIPIRAKLNCVERLRSQSETLKSS